MDYKPLEIIVPTSVKRNDVRTYSVSTRNDVDQAFELFGKEFPGIYQHIESRDPLSIAEFVALTYIITPQRDQFEVIPLDIINTNGLDIRRYSGERVHSFAPINACIDTDYWHCAYGNVLIERAYELAGIEFNSVSSVFPLAHPVIRVPLVKQTYSLRFEDVTGSYLDVFEMDDVKGILFGKKVYPVSISPESVLGLNLVELIRMTHEATLNVVSLKNVQNAIGNLRILIKSFHGVDGYYGLSQKIEENRILKLIDIENELLEK
jgi:hypothetical protein